MPHITVFGDSLSTYGGLLLPPGANAYQDVSYIPDNGNGNVMTAISSAYPAYTINNISRGGMTTDEALSGVQVYVGPGLDNPFGAHNTITGYLSNVKPNIAVIRYGVADGILMGNANLTLKNIDTIIRHAKNCNAEVILIGCNPQANTGEGANPGYFTTNTTGVVNASIIHQQLHDKARRENIKFIDPRWANIMTNGLPDGVHPISSYGTVITNEIAYQAQQLVNFNIQSNIIISV